MQKKRARERIIMFLCIISLLFTPVLAASQSNAMRVSLDLKSATVKEFFDAVKVQTGKNKPHFPEIQELELVEKKINEKCNGQKRENKFR